jgi:hypothetical protein
MNHKLEGEHKYWHENGQLWATEFYQDGKEEGLRMSYTHTGNPLSRVWYKYNKRVGLGKFWEYDSGKPSYIYHFSKREVDITLRILMSILHVKHRLRQRIKSKLRKLYLSEEHLIPDLGNIAMMYYFTGSEAT